MYEEHPDLEKPDDGSTLWRYMDFTKFVSLLDRHALFFARADKLGDPFEGAYTMVNMHPEVQKLLMSDVNEQSRAGLFQYIRAMRTTTLVNCWHESEFESDAMWKIFVGGKNGVALKTTFSSLSKSFRCTEPILIGRVSYKDYETDLISLQNVLFPFFHKRNSFSHEREVRALTTDLSPGATENYRVGGYFEVDLTTLIQEIRIAPDVDEWFVELIHSVAKQYAMDVPIGKSKLADRPIWAPPPDR